MELLILLVIGFLILIFVLPFVAMGKANAAKRSVDDLLVRLSSLEREFREMRRPVIPGAEAEPPPAPAQPRAAEVTPPPLPVIPPVAVPKAPEKPEPARVPHPILERKPSRPSAPPRPAINWEQFMGAKLFAWVGGLALFLGVAFFVKYSFEHNLIPPEVRVAIGFVVGVVLLVGGVLLKRKENAVTAQTLCATGVLVLYTVTFACRSYYHFAFFGLIPTFLLMTLITAVAFGLAARLNAIVVAVLGIAGGFLTPVLLSTGQDHPLGLFVYIALLDVGLLAVAQRKQWNVLPILGAIGTALMQLTWIKTFLVPEKYFNGNKILVAMAVFVGFQALFLAAAAWAKRTQKTNRQLLGCAIGLAAVAMLAAFYFLSFRTIGERPLILLSYLFVVDLGVLALVFVDNRVSTVQGISGLAAFVFLGAWTEGYLTSSLIYVALGFYFLFALFHSAAPLVLQRLRRIGPAWWSHAFPALALVLVLMPIFQLTDLSICVWPFVLFVDVLAFAIAIATATLLPILVVLLLTLVATGAWLFRIPSNFTGLPTGLFLLGGFAVLFLIAGSWAARRLASASASGHGPNLFGRINDPANLSVQLPALSASLPFLLLIMVTLRLPLANPSPVFGLALLFVVLLLGMTKILSLDALPPVALVSVLALEYAWHFRHFIPANAALAIGWYLGFYFVFTVFPFLFHRDFANKTWPWIAAALAGPFSFYLFYHAIRTGYPNGMLGLVPAVLALPPFLGLLVLIKRTPIASPTRMTQLALFGGATLFFITLIFPIQFDRQWITVGWALEGAALCWLFRRIPHPGLRITGIGLLVIVFVRLALNPAVLSYHPRATIPILNWYLCTYGIAAVCLFVAAQLLAPPRHLVLGKNARPLLYTLGVVLAFLLVNIEIADYFSIPGAPALTFQFSGNFARDMSYSIAWALFALLLLIVGMRKKTAPVRYGSLGLLGITVVKLFFHDLSQLDQLYRIGAFVVVAIIAILASFLYQRFLATAEKNDEIKPTVAPAP